MNNPNPKAVPETIMSSTGPSGATSKGKAEVEAAAGDPTHLEKKLLLTGGGKLGVDVPEGPWEDEVEATESSDLPEVLCLRLGGDKEFDASTPILDGKPFGKTVL